MKRVMQVMLDGWVKLPKWILNTYRHIVKQTSVSIVLCSSCAVFGRIREGRQAGRQAYLLCSLCQHPGLESNNPNPLSVHRAGRLRECLNSPSNTTILPQLIDHLHATRECQDWAVLVAAEAYLTRHSDGGLPTGAKIPPLFFFSHSLLFPFHISSHPPMR